jgi:hypothetical protein
MSSRDVFISHSKADSLAAEEVCAVLEGRGFSCWIAPRDVAPGSNYAEEILDAIEETRATVLILSANSNASVHVRHEIERAVSKGKTVFPVRVEDVKPARSIELFVSAAQWIDAFHPSVAEGATRLADALARKLNGATVTATAVAKPVARPVVVAPHTPRASRRGAIGAIAFVLVAALGAVGAWKMGLFDTVRPGVRLAIEGPAKAEVSVDGRLVGQAGGEEKFFALEPGDHKITIAAPSYWRYEKTIRVGSGAAERLEVALQAVNVLELTVTPANAKVAIDGKSIDGSSIELRDGSHQIDVSASGYKPDRQTVTMKGGMRQVMSIKLAAVEERRAAAPAPRPRQVAEPAPAVVQPPPAPARAAAAADEVVQPPAAQEARREEAERGGFGEAFGKSFGESLGRNLGQGRMPGPMPFLPH